MKIILNASIAVVCLGLAVFSSLAYGGESIQITKAKFDYSNLIIYGANFTAFGPPSVSVGDTLLTSCETTNTEITCDITGTPAEASGTWKVSVSAGNSPHTNAAIDVYNQIVDVQRCIPGDYNECYQGEPGTRKVGICQSGTRDCLPDGSWSEECAGQVLPLSESPTGELCFNNLDDDCDGSIDAEDEDCCSTIVEICDGLDNNCNGLIDENLAGGPCTVGIGACARTGNQVCSNGQYECNVLPGTPSAEYCNGLDDDCDGQVDEGLSYNTGTCCQTRSYSCGPLGTNTCTECVAFTHTTCSNGNIYNSCY